KLYVAAGDYQSDTNGNFSSLLVYDPAADSWDQTRASAATARDRAAGAFIGGRLHVTGGVANCAPCLPLGALEAYSVSGNAWETLASLPTPRTGPGAGGIDGKLYVVGGADLGIPSDGGAQHNLKYATLEVFDPVAGTWSTKASMPTARREPGVAVLDGRLYVMGGIITGDAVTNVVEVYDPCTDSWTTVAPLPTARSSFMVGVIGRTIHVVGGRDTDYNTLLTRHDVYTP
ncbi:MAG: hypothetical protein JST92_21670, partial [Deltaproteobacteria bacterium]|nr:hypothetical protein [Deltaproteobacteria bacterium]